MRGKMVIALISLLMVVGIGCSGGKSQATSSKSDPTVIGDERGDDLVPGEEGGEEDPLIPANCTLDEVSTTGQIRRSISRGGVLLASITYEIGPEGFVSINGEECSYEDTFFTETDTTLCHTNVPCGDHQYEYYVDFTNPSNPLWVILDERNLDERYRWVLGSFTGALPTDSTTSSGTYSSDNSDSETSWQPSAPAPLPERPQAPQPTDTGTSSYGNTNNGTGWEAAVQDAYRGQGEAMPYYPVISW